MSEELFSRRSLKSLAVLPMALASTPLLAQLPPPELLLSEPKPALITLGNVDVNPRVQSSFVYDDNISLYERRRGTGTTAAGRSRAPLGDDFIFTFAPGVTAAKATTLEDSPTAISLDYTPSFIMFMKNDSENSIDHRATFKAGYALTKLSLNLSQDFNQTAGGVIDVGNRVSQQSYNTALSARYDLSAKTYLLSEGTYRVTDYESLNDSSAWAIATTANYQFSPKLTLGAGVTGGQLTVNERFRQTVVVSGVTNLVERQRDQLQSYVGPTLRAVYRSTEKTDITLVAGGEYRMYENGDTSFGPVFALSGAYRPFGGTTLWIEGHRREQNSIVLNGANYIATGMSLGVRQRFLERYFAVLNLSYDHADYDQVERRPGTIATKRQDDYFLIRSGVEAVLNRNWTVSLFHQYRENSSSDKGFTFDNNQVGIQLVWGY